MNNELCRLKIGDVSQLSNDSLEAVLKVIYKIRRIVEIEEKDCLFYKCSYPNEEEILNKLYRCGVLDAVYKFGEEGCEIEVNLAEFAAYHDLVIVEYKKRSGSKLQSVKVLDGYEGGNDANRSSIIRCKEMAHSIKVPYGVVEDILEVGDLKLNRRNGDFTCGSCNGSLTPKQLQLMVSIEKLTRNHGGKIGMKSLMDDLNYRAKYKSAFRTLVSKTRGVLRDENHEILCSEKNFDTNEDEFFLLSSFGNKTVK